MRPGLIASTTAHALILAWGIINLGTAKPFETASTDALPIEILTPQEFDAMTKGSKTSKKVEAPRIKAEKVAEADPDPKDDALPVQKEDVDATPPPPTPPVDAAKADAEKAAKAEAEKVEKALAEKAAKAEAVKAEAAKAEAATAKANAEKAEKLAQAAEADRLAKAAADKAAADKLAKAEADKAAKLAKAEADKAAKAEAEKLAKAEAAKAKADAEKAAKAAERKFDPSKIASLLKNAQSKSNSASETALEDKRTPGRTEVAARETAPETTAGTDRGTATKLSLSERNGIIGAIKDQISPCWNPPFGAATGDSLVVSVRVSLNADGSLSAAPTVTNNSSNPAFRAAAGAAMRAIQRCGPLKLPAASYDFWQKVNINFDPKEMMGG